LYRVFQWPFLSSCSFAVMLSVVSGGEAICQTLGHLGADECVGAADRLHSDSLREKAWGAHLAAACQMQELAGEIGAELERLHPDALAGSTWNSEAFWVGHSMLDALIQLREPLPASVLASVAKGLPNERTILMLQNALENRALLAEVRAHPGGGEWVAASNALPRMRAPGFAAALLAEIHVTHGVWVSDRGRLPGRGVAGSLASGAPTMPVPSGFPPIAVYRLTAQHAPGDELVSDGGTPIYSQRTIIEPGVERTLTWPPEGYCSQCLEIEYLAELAHLLKTEVDRCIEPQTPVRWTNLLQLNAEIAQALANQHTALKQLAKLLISAGILDISELRLPLRVEVRIEDQRRNRSVPRPTFTSVEFRLP
jgi:hypothetical protein